MTTQAPARILIIGLDGATLDLVEPWARAGLLPNLARLMGSGGYGRLRSVVPVVSAAAWSTFMTGVNPGKHGVYDFVYREPTSYRLRPTMRSQIAYPSLWRLLSDQGRRVAIINVPLTYPPEPVNGYLVSGLGTPDFKEFTQPAELGERLLRSGYRVNRKMYYPGQEEEAYLQDLQTVATGLTNAALDLLHEGNWDLFTIVYRDTDSVTHAFWRYMDPAHPQHDPTSPFRAAIQNLYVQIDQEIGKLLEAAGAEATVFILSDHGFGPLYKDVFLNEWLRQRGYLVLRQIQPRRRLLSRLGITRAGAAKVLRRLHLKRVEQWLKDRLGDRIDLLPRVEWPDFSEGIDWLRTRAYSYGYQGQIYVNLAGREPQGIVAPGEAYQALLTQLRQELADLIDPADGFKVVDQIQTRAELYHGPASQQAPDLVLTMRGLAYITRLGYELSSQPGEIFAASRVAETGGHRLDGLLIAAGPLIDPAVQEHSGAWLGDLAPTVLHLLECGVPEWMDGRVLHSWLAASERERPVRFTQQTTSAGAGPGADLSAAEEQEIMQRLHDLGYLG